MCLRKVKKKIFEKRTGVGRRQSQIKHKKVLDRLREREGERERERTERERERLKGRERE